MIPNQELHSKTFEELWDIAGAERFGSPMLFNRVLRAFDAFVQAGIFDDGTDEKIWLNALHGYTSEVGISEFEQVRRYFILHILFDYPETYKIDENYEGVTK